MRVDALTIMRLAMEPSPKDGYSIDDARGERRADATIIATGPDAKSFLQLEE